MGRYLEFLAVDELELVLPGQALPGQAPLAVEVMKVPCSKRDIFSSRALSAVEKNRLMKLLRACLDWGAMNLAKNPTEEGGEGGGAKEAAERGNPTGLPRSGEALLASQSDSELVTGRALNRPQNKVRPLPSPLK